ncbi:MAG: OmpA family protein [Sandaracinus sp.]|nr:OmpA family protein [Sandaracinus sp.]
MGQERRFVGGRVALGLFAALLASSPLGAFAQEDIPLERFNVQRFAPAPGPGNYLQVDGARVRGHLAPGAGLTIDYGHQPFVLFNASCTDETETNCEVDDERTKLVAYQLQFNLYGSLVLFERLQVGLNLPLILSNGDGFSELVRGTPTTIEGGTQFTVGDPTLSLKARFFGDGDEGVFLGAVAYASFPVGHAMNDEGFAGDESLRVGGHLVGELVQSNFHVSLNVGGFFRPERTLFSTQQGSALVYRAALGYDVTPLVLVFGEIDGAAGFSGQVDEYPLEGRLGARLRSGDLQFTLAAGAGIISGVGVPLVRVIGGIAYAPERGDQDGDGIEDADDACPAEREDMDGWEDTDGCPDPDNDGDGMLDGVDPCPTEAEDMDGFEDDNGCPDPDNDGDGIPDGYDSCVSEPEDMDGDRDEDGCPDDDTDQDGIPDAQDRCPNEPEDADGLQDEDGCPEDDADGDGIADDGDQCPEEVEIFNGIADDDGCPEADSDSDGIPDDVDRCPNEAETLNGVNDDDGCPDGQQLVEQRADRIVLLQQIQFGTNRARIRGRVSQQILAAVAAILQRNQQYRRVRIEGHTDNAGNADNNVRLSQQRAEAVRDALVALGIAAERLNAQGFGPNQPIGDNTTSEGRALNRRVEFIIEPPEPGGQAIRSDPSAETTTEVPAE